MSDNNYDVIIVGAGMAGLTGAAYLSKAGLRVLLCEKERKTGGLVGSFVHHGFVFDAGIRAFEDSGIILPMLKNLGIRIELMKSPVTIGIESDIAVYGGREALIRYQDLLTKKFPYRKDDIEKIIQEIKKVIGYMDVIYGIDNPLFIDDIMDRQYLMKTLLPWLVRYQINIRKAARMRAPINDYLQQFTQDQALIDMITQHFFGNTPAFFALSYFGQYPAYSYPKGGTGVLAEKLTEFIRRHGGEVRCGAEVSRVDATQRQVVEKNGEIFSYRRLIWAADMRLLYTCLSITGACRRKEKAMIDAQKNLVLSSKPGDSILTVYLEVALDNAFFRDALGAHAFYTPCKRGLSSMPAGWKQVLSAPMSNRDQKEALIQWIRTFLNLTTYEISCPALRDESLAPEGRTGVIVSTLMDYSLVKFTADENWYKQFKEICRDEIVSVLDQSIFVGFSARIEWTQCSTPMSIEKISGNSQGAITGWAFTDGEMPAVNRFTKIAKAVLTPIPDIYQAGQWSFSPSGLPVSILTGKVAADKVIKDLKRPHGSG